MIEVDLTKEKKNAVITNHKNIFFTVYKHKTKIRQNMLFFIKKYELLNKAKI